MAAAVEDWRRGSVTEQNRYMLETGIESDCSFLVGDEAKVFRCHKYPLSRASAVFRAMFHDSQSEGIRVKDVQPPAFQHMLQFVYTDDFCLDDMQMTLDVCHVAAKYKIEALVSACVINIKADLCPKDVCSVLEFARSIKNIELEDFCVQCLQSWTEAVLGADSWVDADLTTVLTLLQQDSLNVDSELSLLSASLRWGQKRTYDWADLRELLAPVLEHVRLRTLTTVEFSNSIYPLGLFSDFEKLEIIICILNRGHAMPLGLCNLSRPRLDVEEITNVATPKAVVLSRHALDELRIEYETLGTRTRMQCYLDLTPSEDILVYGVEIKALDDSEDTKGDTYEEKITLAMVKVRDVMVSARFKGFVKYGSKFKIFFAEPCVVTKDTQFYIRTTYENSKVVPHPNFSYMGHACNVKGVEFKFHPNIDQESHITCVYFKKQQDI